jgi:hypothetical protein
VPYRIAKSLEEANLHELVKSLIGIQRVEVPLWMTRSCRSWQSKYSTPFTGRIFWRVSEFQPRSRKAHKHTKSFNLIDTLSVGIDRIQRNFEANAALGEYWGVLVAGLAAAQEVFYPAIATE